MGSDYHVSDIQQEIERGVREQQERREQQRLLDRNGPIVNQVQRQEHIFQGPPMPLPGGNAGPAKTGMMLDEIMPGKSSQKGRGTESQERSAAERKEHDDAIRVERNRQAMAAKCGEAQTMAYVLDNDVHGAEVTIDVIRRPNDFRDDYTVASDWYENDVADTKLDYRSVEMEKELDADTAMDYRSVEKEMETEEYVRQDMADTTQDFIADRAARENHYQTEHPFEDNIETTIAEATAACAAAAYVVEHVVSELPAQMIPGEDNHIPETVPEPPVQTYDIMER